MTFNSLCSVYPLLRPHQCEVYLLVDRKQTPAPKKEVQLMPGPGEEKASFSKPCLEESVPLKKGPRTVEEDEMLTAYVRRHGDRNWNSVRRYSGLSRCAKSCRLRRINHLRPGFRRGPLQPDEEKASFSKPCLEESVPLKKGPWTVEEDEMLTAYVRRHGDRNWNSVRRYSGLSRCAKSCRLRWINHLRPGLRRGPLQPDEERLIIVLHQNLGNSWSRIAAMLPGRTANEIKNFWNICRKRLLRADLPLYSPPEALEETVEDVGEDICSTLGPSNNNMASSISVSSTSDGWFNLLNWSCSAVNVVDMMNLKSHVLPAVTNEHFFGLEKAVGSKFKDTGMCKRNVSSGKESSAIDFSDVVVMPSLSKRRCVEPQGGIKQSYAIDFSNVEVMPPLSKRRCVEPQGGINLDPTDSSDPSVCDSFPGSKFSCDTKCGYTASNTTNNYFATIRLDEALASLKVELHSVQRHESADSSSALSTLLAASQARQFSDFETMNFVCSAPLNNKGGDLLDGVYQLKKAGHEQLTSVVGDRSSVVPFMDAPIVITAPSAKLDVTQTANDNALSPIGGCSLVLLEDDFSSGALQLDSPFPSFFGGSYLSVELPADVCEDSAWAVPVLYQEEVIVSAIASSVADGGYGGNGDSALDLSTCVWSNMPGALQAYPAPASDDNEA